LCPSTSAAARRPRRSLVACAGATTAGCQSDGDGGFEGVSAFRRSRPRLPNDMLSCGEIPNRGTPPERGHRRQLDPVRDRDTRKTFWEFCIEKALQICLDFSPVGLHENGARMASLSFGRILGIVMTSLLGGIDYNKIINEQNCPDVMRFIDADIFSSLANCSKYSGYAIYQDAGGCGS
jgi:hypothetical protein